MTAAGANDLFAPRRPQSGSDGKPLGARASRRNGQATRKRILEAAFVEFAAVGLAGARVDRIAAAAGCNKSLIFVYFASKAALFETVVEKELERVDSAIGVCRDVLQSAARLFDFAMEHPKSMRLLAWYGLETEADARPEQASFAYGHHPGLKSASSADRLANSVPSGFLLTAIVALSTAWSQGNLIGNLFARGVRDEPGNLRDAVLETVRRLAE